MTTLNHFDKMRIRDFLLPRIPGYNPKKVTGGAQDIMAQNILDDSGIAEHIEIGTRLITDFVSAGKGMNQIGELIESFRRAPQFGHNTFAYPTAEDDFKRDIAPIIGKLQAASPGMSR